MVGIFPIQSKDCKMMKRLIVVPFVLALLASCMQTTAGLDQKSKFSPTSPLVEIFTPKNVKNPPVLIYAHGGSGFQGA